MMSTTLANSAPALAELMNTGAPHFRSMRRQYKNSGYTLAMIVKEYIDNCGKIAKHIRVNVSVSPSSGMIETMTISDDYEKGFEHINESGEKNPFTLGHTRAGQDDDDELNEFGVGMKGAAMAAGDLFKVETKDAHGICHRVEFPFNQMEAEPNVNDSYKPTKTIISLEEYRANHPFPHGSTIVLSGLHPRLHEITSQEQIQKEFEEAISDAYSNYIRKGLTIRVNDVVVEEEHDWFSDPTCELFRRNSKILILEKPNFPRILIAIQTFKNTTYKKYDAPVMQQQQQQQPAMCLSKSKTKSQSRLKHFGKKELDQLFAQGYKPSYTLKPTDMHAIEINSTITFYSPEFDGENPPEPPLNHVHVHKDDRKYGSYPFEHRNDGNCNYNCHKIELKSKQIGKELGITYNKQLPMNIQTDLTRMIREIIDDNNTHLNANTSTVKNEKLCQRYLDEMNVDIMTCNPRKLSTHHKEIRELALIVQQEPIVVQEAPIVVQEAPIVVQEAPIVQQQVPIVQQEPIVQQQAPIVQQQAPIVQQQAPIVVQEEQQEQQEQQEQEEQEEEEQPIAQVIQVQALDLEPDSVREVGPSVHQSINRAKGERIIDHWLNSREHQATLNETVGDILAAYLGVSDWIALNKFMRVLNKMTPFQKCELLIELMQERYPLPEERMCKGIELFRAYRDAFGTDAVAVADVGL